MCYPFIDFFLFDNNPVECNVLYHSERVLQCVHNLILHSQHPESGIWDILHAGNMTCN